MALTTAEAAELASLTDALTRARTGQLVTRIVYNGQETDFSKVDLPDLRARVEELNSLAASSSCTRRRGAVSFRL